MDTIASLFSFITTPVSWVIVQFHSLYGAIFGPDTGWAWGLSIVSLVVLIRICLIPLFVKQIKSTRGMQALQPKMKAIQERYKSDKQRQSEEMMKLYKETGTNPLSSCLPIIAQSPFFFALYHVLSAIANGQTKGYIDKPLLESAQKAHIFGAPLAAKFLDSSDKVAALGATLTDVRIVTAVMIIMMSASQFYTQRQLMTKNVDMSVKTPFMQQQKMLMYVFPVMFAVMGVNFPVGVLVYWLTTNVWTMGQQMFVIHRNPTPGSQAQSGLLERMQKHLIAHGSTRTRHQRSIIKGVASKETKDRNEAERKFITTLSKAGLVAQADGTVEKSDAAVAAEAEGVSLADAAPKRQQPKRQTKAKRQTGAAQTGAPQAGQAQAGASKAAETPAETEVAGADEKTSLEKSEPQEGDSKPDGKPASRNARQAKPGQRKGQQRPKHPSKK